VSKKSIPKPAAWKNTYFWIAGILALLAVFGLIGGDNVIRDPGQRRESSLWVIYILASVVMAINGFLSHRQTVQAYNEALENE